MIKTPLSDDLYKESSYENCPFDIDEVLEHQNIGLIIKLVGHQQRYCSKKITEKHIDFYELEIKGEKIYIL